MNTWGIGMKMPMRVMVLTLMLVLSLLAGCANQPSKKSDVVVDQIRTFSTFDGFSKALGRSFSSDDSSFFIDHLDMRQFTQRSLASLGMYGMREKTIARYMPALKKTMSNVFKETVKEVSSARYVRRLTEENSSQDEAVCLIRLEIDGGLDYWKVHLRRVNGQIKIIDWFNYTLGDLASHSLGSYLLQVHLASTQPKSPDLVAINGYVTAVKSMDPQNVLDAYDQLPTLLKRNSLMMANRVQSAIKVSEKVYYAVLTDHAPLYQKQDNYALLLVDHYLFTEQYKKAHQAIDTVTSQIGNDAGLDSLHAMVAHAAGDYKKAIGFARDGIRREASYETNYLVLLDALVFSKYYSDAVLVLNILQEGFDYLFDAKQLSEIEGYQNFSRSDAFRDWRAASGEAS
ncbi:MAG: hypothetical protein V3U84_06255 [Thiotrichaceae bacterium]